MSNMPSQVDTTAIRLINVVKVTMKTHKVAEKITQNADHAIQAESPTWGNGVHEGQECSRNDEVTYSRSARGGLSTESHLQAQFVAVQSDVPIPRTSSLNSSPCAHGIHPSPKA